MNRTHALTMLLRLGPLRSHELLEITGWSSKVLHRTLAVASVPTGPVFREGRGRRSVFRVKAPEEIQRRRPSTKPGSTWTPAQRAANERYQQRRAAAR